MAEFKAERTRLAPDHVSQATAEDSTSQAYNRSGITTMG